MADFDDDGKDQGESSGSIWTSFSDLFTTLSIIFLVMFVIAILKLALSSLETHQAKESQKKYLEGEIPEEIQKKITSKSRKLEDSVNALVEMQKDLNQRTKKINKLISSISNHKENVSTILKEHAKKDVALKKLTAKLRTEKKNAKEQTEKASILSKKLAAAESKTEKIQSKKEELSARSEELEGHLVKLKDELERTAQKKKRTESELTTKLSQLQKKLQKRDEKVLHLEETLGSAKKEISQQKQAANENKKFFEEFKKKAEKEQLVFAGRAEKARRENANLKSKIESQVSRSKSEMSSLNGQISELKEQLSDSMEQLSSAQGEIEKFEGKVGRLESGMKRKSARIDELVGLNTQLKLKQWGAIGQAAQRAPASMGVRGEIAQNISNRFDKMDLDVKTDVQTGNITLFFDEAFLFVNDSFQLKDGVKNKLNIIIPVYAEELFKDPKTREKIESVNVVGHASPRYRSSPVDPMKADSDAFNHNLALSSARAVQITKYFLSDEAGSYQFKNLLRTKVNTIGKSFMQPVLLNEEEKPVGGRCGQFSCRRSRRVEISFSLKNENKKTTQVFYKESK